MHAKGVPQGRHLGEYSISYYVSDLVVSVTIEASSCGIGSRSEHWLPGCSMLSLCCQCDQCASNAFERVPGERLLFMCCDADDVCLQWLPVESTLGGWWGGFVLGGP